MNTNLAKLSREILGALLCLFISAPLHGQVASSVLRGTVTDSSGAFLPGIAISVKNVATGESRATQTDSKGTYNVADLAPGAYEVSASAKGYSPKTTNVTVTTGGKQTVDLVLASAFSQAPSMKGCLVSLRL
jgi:uncharacterized membrane protein